MQNSSSDYFQESINCLMSCKKFQQNFKNEEVNQQCIQNTLIEQSIIVSKMCKDQ